MAELIDIKRVLIGPENLLAYVRIADDAPLMTSEDLEGTARVYRVLPHIVEHVCLGDAGNTFRDAMGDTEIAHLLEHVTVELLAQTNLAGDISAGRTWVDEVDDRTYQIELACPDDVLVAAALSCGVWILDWAYRGGSDSEPNVEAIVDGLVQLVQSVGDKGEDLVIDEGLDNEVVIEDEAHDAYDDEPAYEQGDSGKGPVSQAGAADDADAGVADHTAENAAEPAMEATESEADVTVVQEPAQSKKPLWTQAPDVPSVARTHALRYRREPAEPEVEAQIDEIMATIEMPAVNTGEHDAHVSDESGASAI